MKRKLNLKFIKLYFKHFVNIGVSGILCKNLQETGIDLDGDTVLGVSRFGFGKNKIKNLYVNVKQNMFVILKDKPADGPDVPSMYPKIITIKDPKTVKDLGYNEQLNYTMKRLITRRNRMINSKVAFTSYIEQEHGDDPIILPSLSVLKKHRVKKMISQAYGISIKEINRIIKREENNEN